MVHYIYYTRYIVLRHVKKRELLIFSKNAPVFIRRYKCLIWFRLVGAILACDWFMCRYCDPKNGRFNYNVSVCWVWFCCIFLCWLYDVRMYGFMYTVTSFYFIFFLFYAVPKRYVLLSTILSPSNPCCLWFTMMKKRKGHKSPLPVKYLKKEPSTSASSARPKKPRTSRPQRPDFKSPSDFEESLSGDSFISSSSSVLSTSSTLEVLEDKTHSNRIPPIFVKTTNA